MPSITFWTLLLCLSKVYSSPLNEVSIRQNDVSVTILSGAYILNDSVAATVCSISYQSFSAVALIGSVKTLPNCQSLGITPSATPSSTTASDQSSTTVASSTTISDASEPSSTSNDTTIAVGASLPPAVSVSSQSCVPGTTTYGTLCCPLNTYLSEDSVCVSCSKGYLSRVGSIGSSSCAQGFNIAVDFITGTKGYYVGESPNANEHKFAFQPVALINAIAVYAPAVLPTSSIAVSTAMSLEMQNPPSSSYPFLGYCNYEVDVITTLFSPSEWLLCTGTNNGQPGVFDQKSGSGFGAETQVFRLGKPAPVPNFSKIGYLINGVVLAYKIRLKMTFGTGSSVNKNGYILGTTIDKINHLNTAINLYLVPMATV